MQTLIVHFVWHIQQKKDTQMALQDLDKQTKELFEKAANYCAREEQCPSQVRTKLYQWGAGRADAETIITLLKEQRFLDEQRYAEAFCQSKTRYQHWGRLKIEAHLQQKGIPSQTIATAMATIDDGQYLEVLLDVAEKKWSTLPQSPQRRTKLVTFLLSRGYEMALAQKTATLVAQNDGEDSSDTE